MPGCDEREKIEVRSFNYYYKSDYMVEEVQLTADRVQSKGAFFETEKTLKLDKNIDRVIEAKPGEYVLASYHLDKESGTKSGSLTWVDDSLNILKHIDLNYGILSITQESSGDFLVACSVGLVR